VAHWKPARWFALENMFVVIVRTFEK
jgi:hypothetical protein